MSKTLIYLIAIYALWLYFSFGNFGGKTANNGNAAGGFGSSNRGGSFGGDSGFGGVRT